jgi:hypothetical protein
MPSPTALLHDQLAQQIGSLLDHRQWCGCLEGDLMGIYSETRAAAAADLLRLFDSLARPPLDLLTAALGAYERAVGERPEAIEVSTDVGEAYRSLLADQPALEAVEHYEFNGIPLVHGDGVALARPVPRLLPTHQRLMRIHVNAAERDG